MARDNFIKEIASITREDLIYIDELGVANNLTTLYGWSLKGERSYAEQIGFASDRRKKGFHPRSTAFFHLLVGGSPIPE